jgi:hypothetical protein
MPLNIHVVLFVETSKTQRERERERERETWMFLGESIPYAKSLAIDMNCSFRLAKKEIILFKQCGFRYSFCYWHVG